MTTTETDLRIEGFAERIRLVRAVKLCLHVTEMAILLGVPHTTLKSWEDTTTSTKPRDIVDIADRYVAVCAEFGLTISADWILRGGVQMWSEMTPATNPQLALPFPRSARTHSQRENHLAGRRASL